MAIIRDTDLLYVQRGDTPHNWTGLELKSLVSSVAKDGKLIIGNYLTPNGSEYDGSANLTINVDGTSSSTPDKVVVRDADGSFAGNIISAVGGQFSNDVTVGGELTLSKDPVENLQAATKQYVDSLTGSTGFVFISDTPPPAPSSGDLWWNTSDGTLYVMYEEDNYNDGAGPGTRQWVVAVPTGGEGGSGAPGGSSAEVLIQEEPPFPDLYRPGTLWWDNSEESAQLYILYNNPPYGKVWVEITSSISTSDEYVLRTGDQMVGDLAMGEKVAQLSGIWKTSGDLLLGGDVFASEPNIYLHATDGSATFVGNVGIGTTSSQTRLDVTGNSTFTGDVDITGNLTVDTDTLFVDASTNRVGIGTTSPTNPLSVYHATTNNVAVFESGDDNCEISLVDNSGRAAIGNVGDNLRFLTSSSGTERARIDSAGRLLVGIDDARTNFYYSTTARTPEIQYESSGSNTALSVLRDDGLATLYLANAGEIGPNTGLGGLNFVGNDGTNLRSFAKIEARSDGEVSTDDVPGCLVFGTTEQGNDSPQERARIDSAGRFLVGTSTARTNLSLNSGSTHDGLVQYETTSEPLALSLCRNAEGAPVFLSLSATGGSSIGSTAPLSENDGLGTIIFSGMAGLGNFKTGARIAAEVDAARTESANEMPCRLVFSTTADGEASPTERMRITSNGTIQLRNSPGIDFSQIQTNAASGTISSETLDSYEEGTWTPGLYSGGTSVIEDASGIYTKIGNLVYVTFFISISSADLGSSTRLSGLPFAYDATEPDIFLSRLGQAYDSNLDATERICKAVGHTGTGSALAYVDILLDNTVSRIGARGNFVMRVD